VTDGAQESPCRRPDSAHLTSMSGYVLGFVDVRGLSVTISTEYHDEGTHGTVIPGSRHAYDTTL
jgi:hypothetical protein